MYLFRNFDPSSSNGLKVQNFVGLDWGVSPQPGIPHFSPTLVLPDIFNRSNFEYSALSGLKVDSWRRKRQKKVRKKTTKKKNDIQAGVNEHDQKKDGW